MKIKSSNLVYLFISIFVVLFLSIDHVSSLSPKKLIEIKQLTDQVIKSRNDILNDQKVKYQPQKEEIDLDHEEDSFKLKPIKQHTNIIINNNDGFIFDSPYKFQLDDKDYISSYLNNVNNNKNKNNNNNNNDQIHPIEDDNNYINNIEIDIIESEIETDRYENIQDDLDQCNHQSIVGDWGFRKLSIGDESVWQLEVPNSNSSDEFIQTTFPTRLSDDYNVPSIRGYHAVCLNSTYLGQDSLVYLNTSIDLFEPSMMNDTLILYFSYASTLMLVDIVVFAGGTQEYSLQRTLASYSQDTQTVPLTLGDLPANGGISFALQFNGQAEFCLYDIYVIRYSQVTKEVNQVYVSTEIGSDINGTGSLENPFSSIQQAINYNDVNVAVILLPGLYCGQGNSWITIGAINVTIQSFNDTQPVLSGMGLNHIIDYHQFDPTIGLQLINIALENPSTLDIQSAIHISGTSTFVAINCTFRNLYSNYSISLDYLTYAEFNNCSFSNFQSYALTATGLTGTNKLTITDTKFSGTYTLFVLNMANVRIKNTHFAYAPNQTTAQPCSILTNMVVSMTILSSVLQQSLCAYTSNLTFTNSVYWGGPWTPAAILTQNTDMTIDNVYFGQYTCSSLLLSFRGILTVRNSIFNNTAAYTYIMVEKGAISVTNSTFLPPLSTAIILDTSTAEINLCSFILVGSFIQVITSALYMQNSIIVENTFSNRVAFSTIKSTSNVYMNCNGPLFQLYSSSLYDTMSSMMESQSTYATAQSTSSIFLSGNVFAKNRQLPLLVATDESYVEVFSTIFYDNTAVDGAVVQASAQSILSFTQCNFTSNRVKGRGGVASIMDAVTMSFDSCFFSQNYAAQGGIVASSSTGHTNFTAGIAEFNSAHEGSIVYYTNTEPVLLELTMMNNTQTFGDEVQLGLATIYLNSSNLPDEFTPTIVSGDNELYFLFGIVDNNQAPLTNRFCQTKCLIYLYVGGQFVDSAPISASGFAVFDNLTLVGPIGKEVDFVISSNEPTIKSLTLAIQFDNCTAGYFPDPSGTICDRCDAGTYGLDGQTCTLCPEFVSCFGGTTYEPDPGYWIDPMLSPPVAFQCPSGLCLPGNSCLEYHTGPLCADCIPDYYNCGAGCKKQNGINAPVIVIKLIIFFVLVLFQQMSNDSSGLVTIALYFLQTLAVISTGIKFSIVDAISGGSTAHSSSSTSSILSFLNNCIAPIGFYWNHYIVVMQPVLLIIILGFIVIVELVFRRTGIIFRIPLIKRVVNASEIEFRNRQVSAFIKVCMNSYGPFITEVLLILFCVDVGSLRLLNANPAVQCGGSNYSIATQVTYGLLPLIIGFPIVIFFLLFRKRKEMEQPDVERQLGVFFLKYKPSFYFWDVVLLLKRLSIAAFALIASDSPLRSISLVLVSFGSLFLQLTYRPFLSDMDNNLETVSLTLLFVSCIYLDNDLYLETEQYLLIISVVVFVVAAIKLQGQYFMNEIRTVAKPILDRIDVYMANSRASKRRKNSRAQKKYAQFNYDDEEERPEVEKDVVGKVDRRAATPSSYSSVYLSSNTPSQSSPLLRGNYHPSSYDTDNENENFDDDDDDDDDEEDDDDDFNGSINQGELSNKYML